MTFFFSFWFNFTLNDRLWAHPHLYKPPNVIPFYGWVIFYCGHPWWLRGKEPACQRRNHRFDLWVRKILWRRKEATTSEFLPGKLHGQRSLAGHTQSTVSQRVGHYLATTAIFPCIYVESREVYRWTYFQGRNRQEPVPNVENGHVEIVGGWESGMNWDSSINICTLPCERDSSWEPGAKHRKLSSVPCDDLEGWNGCGKGGSDGGDVCTQVAYSLHRTAEASATLQLYTS